MNVAEHDPAHPVEPPGAEQLGEHPVEPVELLADVLEHRDRLGGRSEFRVPTSQASSATLPPTSTPAARPRRRASHRRRGERRARRRVEEHRAEVRPRLVVAGAEMVDHRPVDRGEAEPGGERLVQGGDVGEPDEHLGTRGGERVPVQQVDHPLHAVPAACAEHRLHLGVAPGPHQVVGAGGVVGGEVAEAFVGPAHVLAHGTTDPRSGVRRGRGRGAPARPAPPGRRPRPGLRCAAAPRGSGTGRPSSGPAPRPCAGAGPPRAAARSARARRPGRRRRRPRTRSARPGCRSGRGRSRAAGCRGTARSGAARRRTCRWPGATRAGRAPGSAAGR